MKIYDFFWTEFCDWYLEISKGELKNPAVLKHVLETVLILLHPFAPFITEVIWGNLQTLPSKKTLLIGEKWPKHEKSHAFPEDEKSMTRVLDVVSTIRSARAEYKVEPVKKIKAAIYSKFHKDLEAQREPIMRLARLDELEISAKGKRLPKSKSIILPQIEIYLPLEEMIDTEKEKARLAKEIRSLTESIEKIELKLSNKGFVNNAPRELVDREKIKLDETRSNLNKLKKEESLL